MKAHELLSDPAKFCAKAWALDATGKNCMPTSPDAVQWDASGAISKCYGWGTLEAKAAWKAANELAHSRHSVALSRVCDWHGYCATLAVLRDANV